MQADPGLTVHFDGAFTRAPVKAFNTLSTGLRRLGVVVGDLSRQSLRAAARKETGLNDFGEGSFEEPLSMLLQGLEAEASLHPFGTLNARKLLVSSLANRLLIEEEIKRHPAILDKPVRRPLFILGLPRTGTTLLFNLLACDPAHRCPTFWEVHQPAPSPEPETHDRDPRLKIAERQVRIIDYLAPSLFGMHELVADGVEECYPLLNNTFTGMHFYFMFSIPSYQRWYKEQDLTPSYEYYRRQIQILQFHYGKKHWVLKSPAHMFAARTLLSLFPDALIIQPHRDPLKVIPSICSLTATMQGINTYQVDTRQLGQELADTLAFGMERCSAARRHGRPEQFYDLYFSELVRDPIAAVERIYEYFDFPKLTTETRLRMEQWMKQNPKNKRGVHEYSLEQFHLDAKAERKRFGEYQETFRIPLEEES